MSINYEQLAQKHDISVSAVQHLAQAIAQGYGRQAQFNHPELGGMGQWMPTMLMIGDAFNYALKAKVDILCNELARAYRSGDIPSYSPMSAISTVSWWSADYTDPTLAGAQNSIRYAYFARYDRLILMQDGQEATYDTAPHKLSGVSQQQSTPSVHLVFHTQDGKTLNISDFRKITS